MISVVYARPVASRPAARISTDFSDPGTFSSGTTVNERSARARSMVSRGTNERGSTEADFWRSAIFANESASITL